MNILEQLNIEQKRIYYTELTKLCTENRIHLFEKIIEQRTKHQTIVIENIYQSHNASAVLRTADCLGIQDIHVIENNNQYEINPDVALGSSKWIDLYRYNREANNTKQCLSTLKGKGYKIVATLPSEKNVMLEDININEKLAVVFGNELKGLSDIAIGEADIYMKIPMYGFTESFNISVSAAITMYSLSNRLRKSNVDWQLSDEEKLDTLIKWVKHTIKYNDKVEKEILLRLGFIK
ncbi:MAG: RNA methyltransferase [Bacteroidales bacterium]|jgi:tRNA (guanosine-2'-O-)-methyltransferase|nr:RNA methyltransferase [Bacteroidales bacterium]